MEDDLERGEAAISMSGSVSYREAEESGRGLWTTVLQELVVLMAEWRLAKLDASCRW